MAKDAKGHGSNARGGASLVEKPWTAEERQGLANMRAMGDRQAAAELAQGSSKSGAVPVHNGASGPSVTIHHHPDYDEYRVPNPGEKGKGAGYFTNDKQDAMDTARAIHGPSATFKIRSKRYETV